MRIPTRLFMRLIGAVSLLSQSAAAQLTATSTTAPVEAFRKQQAVISWLKINAVPLKTVEAGNEFADLQPLKQIVKDVRLVGLGDATHGTRELFQVKPRQ